MKTGTKVLFTPTNKVFEIAKVTDKRVSWYVGFSYKGGNGINTLKMASTSRRLFQEGIDNGSYKIIE